MKLSQALWLQHFSKSILTDLSVIKIRERRDAYVLIEYTYLVKSLDCASCSSLASRLL